MSTSMARRPMGRVEELITGLFTRRATVTKAVAIGDRFRLLELAGEELRGAKWTPGDKIQIALGGWAMRTYTPIAWDAEKGTTSIVAYAHDGGDQTLSTQPGSVWTRGAEPGEPCTLFGPRGSVDLEQLASPALVFGDETSFGLVHALRHATAAKDAAIVLEVTSVEASKGALEALDVRDAELVERRPRDAHLEDVERLVTKLVEARRVQAFALTGKASSIQALNRRVRALGFSSRAIRAKAYWAPGKRGLD